MRCPSSTIVTVAGAKVADVQDPEDTTGAVASANVTTVPSGRVVGPPTTVPSAVTVRVPAAVVEPSRK